MPATSGHLLLFCLCSETFPLLTSQRGAHTFLSPFMWKQKTGNPGRTWALPKPFNAAFHQNLRSLAIGQTIVLHCFHHLGQNITIHSERRVIPVVVAHLNHHSEKLRVAVALANRPWILLLTLLRIFWTDLPPPATRDRPPGCKTVFVGGLPENSTEQLIMELFGQCGDITAIRKSKKNFCHIRFADEFTVDKALFLSGTLSAVQLLQVESHVGFVFVFFCPKTAAEKKRVRSETVRTSRPRLPMFPSCGKQLFHLHKSTGRCDL